MKKKKCDVNCAEIGFYLLLCTIPRVLLTYCFSVHLSANAVIIFYRQLLLLGFFDRCQCIRNGCAIAKQMTE